MKSTFTKEEEQYIAESYDKIPYQEMATKLGRNYNSVRGVARRMGVVVPRHISGKYKPGGLKACYVNESFFTVPNPLNCYWAGFIAADGSITCRSDFDKSLFFKLSTKDLKHLETFKEQIEHKGNLHFKNQ